MEEDKQIVSEPISFCSPMASMMRAEAIAPIGQLDYETVMDVEKQEDEKVFEERVNDKEKVTTGNSDFQDSQGRLDLTKEPCSFQTVDEKFEELNIDIIEHFTEIPDFNMPCDCKYPLVTHTPSGFYCTDGWALIQAAKEVGRTSIICDVEYVESHSEDELAFRKVAGRVKPKAGIASYAETVRNAKYLERRLLASNSDVRVFCHGGARRGGAFSNNIEDNLRKVLSIRLGRSVTTINQFLNHGASLNDEILNFLASENTAKDFFEKAQAVKRTQITAMKSSRASNEDITAEISKMMLDWYGEFKGTGKITSVWNEGETDTQTDSGRRKISTGTLRNPRVAKSDKPEVLAMDDEVDDDIESLQEPGEAEILEEVLLNPRGVDTMEEKDSTLEEEEDSDSFQKIKSDTEEIAQRLLVAVTLDDPDLFYEQIVEEVASLHRISLRARVFGKEAAVLEH